MRFLFISLFALVFNGCAESLDCSLVQCINYFQQIQLTQINTGENILISEELTDEDISVVDSNNETIQSTITNGELWVFSSKRRDEGLIIAYNEITIQYSYEIVGGGSTCCDFGELGNVEVIDNEFTVGDNLLEIFVE